MPWSKLTSVSKRGPKEKIVTKWQLILTNCENYYINIDALVQDHSISIANAMEILQSCTKPSISTCYVLCAYYWVAKTQTRRHHKGLCQYKIDHLLSGNFHRDDISEKWKFPHITMWFYIEKDQPWHFTAYHNLPYLNLRGRNMA